MKLRSRVREKLNSQSGISILFAMVLFLVVTMVCVVIVTTAVSALKRAKANRELIQDSMVLESAARLIASELDGTTYSYTTTEIYRDKVLYSKTESAVTVTDGIFKQEAIQVIEELLENPLEEGSFTVIASPEEMDNVSVIYAVSKDSEETELFHLIFTLESEKKLQTMFVSFDLQYKETETSSDESYIIPDGSGKKGTRIIKEKVYTFGLHSPNGISGRSDQ